MNPLHAMNANAPSASKTALPGPPGSAEPMAFAGPRKGITGQTIVLLILVGCSAAALMGMRVVAQRSGMDLRPVELPKELTDAAEPSTGQSKDFERVMSDLQRMQQSIDVQLGELGTRPFGPRRTVAIGPVGPQEDMNDLAAREAAAKRRRLDDAFAKLHLQSVLGGSVSVARINSKAYRVGDTIDGVFEIVAISGRRVELRAEDVEFTLDMDLIKDAGKH